MKRHDMLSNGYDRAVDNICYLIESNKLFRGNHNLPRVGKYVIDNVYERISNVCDNCNIEMRSTKSKYCSGYALVSDDNKNRKIFLRKDLDVHNGIFVWLHEVVHVLDALASPVWPRTREGECIREIKADLSALIVWNYFGGDWGGRPRYLARQIYNPTYFLKCRKGYEKPYIYYKDAFKNLKPGILEFSQYIIGE